MDTEGVSWLRCPILDKGAFDSVFLATSRYPLSRKTARCFLPKMAVKSADFDASDSLKKEKEVLCNLRGCPHVVQCFGEEITFGMNGDMVYNVLLEYASGGTLAHFIKNSNSFSLPEIEVRRYTKCLLQGLREVHDCGYVHCDLKPDNVLLFPGKNSCGYLAKLGDFGLARRSGRESKRHRLVWSSYLRGTVMYMAPETVVDHVQQLPSDVWSLGCVVLEMLTGNRSWTSKHEHKLSNKEVLDMISDHNLLPDIPSGVSREGRDFLKRCLVRKPEIRLTAEMLLNHPFVQGFDDVEFEEAEEEDRISEESLSYDAECSSHYSSFTFTSEEEDFDCAGDTVEDDDLFQALTQASSSPAMQRPSFIAILADA